MKSMVICFTSFSFLTGCVLLHGEMNKQIHYSPSETERMSHYGYAEFFSSGLFEDKNQLISAALTYYKDDGTYKEKKVFISGLHPQDDQVLFYIPKFEGWSLYDFELVVNYGELRVISSKNVISLCKKNSLSSEPLTLKSGGYDLKITSYFKEDGWRFCGIILKRIIK